MASRLPILQPSGGPAPPSAAAPFSAPASRRIYIDTYGCQMNEHDSNRMFELMAAEGYAPTGEPEQADLLIINSCSVREKAEHKLLSAAGKLKHIKRRRPDVVIALAGCVASQEGKALLDRVEHADLVLGPDHIGRLPELVRRAREERARLFETEFLDRQDYLFPEIRPGAHRISEFVSVMKGCDKFCTFCVVPMTRGREVSRRADEIVREVAMLATGGTKEVVLLGQTVNSYGRLEKDGEVPFHVLLERVAEVQGIERIRFTSPHPAEFSDQQIAAFRTLGPKLCPHMHLPVQSGSNRVLRAMRRGYTREEYLALVDRFRDAVPEATLTTDIIVGFPSETEAEFEETLTLLERVRFAGAFSFAYSERSGTRALGLEPAVPHAERLRRLQVLQAFQETITRAGFQAEVGRRVEVLSDGPSKSDPRRWSGRTPQNRSVHVDGEFEAGRLVQVEVVEAFNHSLLGRRVEA
jgi:tRNA-2-methylthio-N6-dimethylallyladenosine synthase